ncbi:MAG: SGNH/GDSL hydrolase family protein [Oscillospiraceae bacterium]|nr:SGNH/GDSL hydrolase family protein [Oscillospiraceae bacterium]
MKKIKTVLSVAAVLVAAAVMLGLLTRLLEPKYATDLEEGSFLAQYYEEAGGHDVIFIGDCEVYANFSPMELYRDYGITAYVRGTSQQLIWQSYYILKETLEYETPKAVVYNVNAMRYSEPVSEAYNRLTIDNMRWSDEKIGIIRASMTEEEDFMSYVFPILRYHSRFDELTAEDLQYFFQGKTNTFNGYQMNTNVVSVGTLPTKRVLRDYSFRDICWQYLEEMTRLCQEKGVELILIKAPSLYPYWYDQYDAQIQQYADQNGLAYYNFTTCAEEIGLDFSTDTYDGGLHLNLAGAVKMSRYFGSMLADVHGMPDRRDDPQTAAIYEEKLRAYDAEAQKEKGTNP